MKVQRRTGSGYTGLKKGFAERHILTVKDMIVKLQEDYQLPSGGKLVIYVFVSRSHTHSQSLYLLFLIPLSRIGKILTQSRNLSKFAPNLKIVVHSPFTVAVIWK